MAVCFMRKGSSRKGSRFKAKTRVLKRRGKLGAESGSQDEYEVLHQGPQTSKCLGRGARKNIFRRKLNCGYNLIREGDMKQVAGGEEIKVQGRGAAEVEARGAGWVERWNGGVLKTVVEGKSHN